MFIIIYYMMPTVEQIKKVVARTLAGEGADKVLFSKDSAFSQKSLVFNGIIQASNEYFTRDQVAPVLSSMVSLDANNAEMLSDLVGLIATEYIARKVLPSDMSTAEYDSMVEQVVKYAVSYNVGDILADMVTGTQKTTTQN